MNLAEIEQQLREALAHIYDPDFQPSQELSTILGCKYGEGGVEIQAGVIRAIEELKPSEAASPNPRIEQFYELLHNRFVSRMTLAETAQRMHLSFSSTWREQRSAIHFLVMLLWRHSHEVPPLPGTETGTLTAPSGDWEEQTRRELAALYSYSPAPTCDVGESIRRICELQRELAARRTNTLEIGAIQPDLVAALPSTAMRQILITATGNLIRLVVNRRIMLFARMEDGNIQVTMAARTHPEDSIRVQDLQRDIPLPDSSTMEARVEREQVFLWIRLPSVGRINVLVVDDNPDMVHYYQRSTEGTNYHIIHLDDGRRLFDQVQSFAPDIIVLDVMLPYLDGWDLLMQLRANPLTRLIPVLVCSVIREEELALSLGATGFVAKPVQPENFIQALDQVLVQAP
jgi:CheY-like chemotaxis protein